MIKRLLGGELPIFQFVKDSGIFGILRRKFLFDLFCFLDEGSGKCGFLNVGVVFS